MAYSKDEVFARSDSVGEHNDCTVKALALTTRHSYDSAHAILTEAGRKKGRGPSWYQWRAAFPLAGYHLLDITHKIKAKTITTLEREGLPKLHCYVVEVRGHVVAMRGGKVLDWTQGRRYRINRVLRVVKNP